VPKGKGELLHSEEPDGLPKEMPEKFSQGSLKSLSSLDLWVNVDFKMKSEKSKRI
jgi:hypothetical protein